MVTTKVVISSLTYRTRHLVQTESFMHFVSLPDGPEIGEVHIDNAGVVQWISVRKEYRRQGVATALWRYAQSVAGTIHHGHKCPVPVHSPIRTTAGDAWVASLGDIAPRNIVGEDEIW